MPEVVWTRSAIKTHSQCRDECDVPMLDLSLTGSWRGAVLESEQTPMAAASNDSGSAGQACTGVDDLHTLDEEPQCQPDFSDEAHGEPGVGDRGVGRQ